jgi:co-chaperonin GroES (HSP10)
VGAHEDVKVSVGDVVVVRKYSGTEVEVDRVGRPKRSSEGSEAV